jgi:hypothetical protein
MYDNLNSFRADLADCEQTTESVEGLGSLTFVSANGEAPEINIYPADTQGSLEPFFEGHGDFFLISYIGKLPSFSYEYHIDEVPEGPILEVEAKDDMFLHIKFDPNADLSAGTVAKPIAATALTGMNIAKVFADDKKPEIKTFIVQMLLGRALVDKNRVNCVDIVAYVDGQRNTLSRSYVDAPTYGTLRKRFRIALQDTTKILTCSFGRMNVPVSGNSDTDDRNESMHLSDLSVKDGYSEVVKTITAMLDAPNKLYNTEVNI